MSSFNFPNSFLSEADRKYLNLPPLSTANFVPITPNTLQADTKFASDVRGFYSLAPTHLQEFTAPLNLQLGETVSSGSGSGSAGSVGLARIAALSAISTASAEPIATTSPQHSLFQARVVWHKHARKEADLAKKLEQSAKHSVDTVESITRERDELAREVESMNALILGQFRKLHGRELSFHDWVSFASKKKAKKGSSAGEQSMVNEDALCNTPHLCDQFVRIAIEDGQGKLLLNEVTHCSELQHQFNKIYSRILEQKSDTLLVQVFQNDRGWIKENLRKHEHFISRTCQLAFEKHNQALAEGVAQCQRESDLKHSLLQEQVFNFCTSDSQIGVFKRLIPCVKQEELTSIFATLLIRGCRHTAKALLTYVNTQAPSGAKESNASLVQIYKNHMEAKLAAEWLPDATLLLSFQLGDHPSRLLYALQQQRPEIANNLVSTYPNLATRTLEYYLQLFSTHHALANLDYSIILELIGYGADPTGQLNKFIQFLSKSNFFTPSSDDFSIQTCTFQTFLNEMQNLGFQLELSSLDFSKMSFVHAYACTLALHPTPACQKMLTELILYSMQPASNLPSDWREAPVHLLFNPSVMLLEELTGPLLKSNFDTKKVVSLYNSFDTTLLQEFNQYCLQHYQRPYFQTDWAHGLDYSQLSLDDSSSADLAILRDTLPKHYLTQRMFEMYFNNKTARASSFFPILTAANVDLKIFSDASEALAFLMEPNLTTFNMQSMKAIRFHLNPQPLTTLIELMRFIRMECEKNPELYQKGFQTLCTHFEREFKTISYYAKFSFGHIAATLSPTVILEPHQAAISRINYQHEMRVELSIVTSLRETKAATKRARLKELAGKEKKPNQDLSKLKQEREEKAQLEKDITKLEKTSQDQQEVIDFLLQRIRDRVRVTSTPSGLAKNFTQNQEDQCLALEAKWRKECNEKNYPYIEHLRKLLGTSTTELDKLKISLKGQQEWVQAQMDRENFFLHIENKFRIVIFYLHTLSADIQLARKAGKAAEAKDLEILLTNHRDVFIYDMALCEKGLCANSWSWQIGQSEQHALNYFGKSTSQQTSLQTELYKELFNRRNGLMTNWARDETQKKTQAAKDGARAGIEAATKTANQSIKAFHQSTIEALEKQSGLNFNDIEEALDWGKNRAPKNQLSNIKTMTDRMRKEVASIEMGIKTRITDISTDERVNINHAVSLENHLCTAALQLYQTTYKLPPTQEHHLKELNPSLTQSLKKFLESHYQSTNAMTSLSLELFRPGTRLYQLALDDFELSVGDWRQNDYAASAKQDKQRVQKILNGVVQDYERLRKDFADKPQEFETKAKALFATIWPNIIKDQVVILNQYKESFQNHFCRLQPFGDLCTKWSELIDNASESMRRSDFKSLHVDEVTYQIYPWNLVYLMLKYGLIEEHQKGLTPNAPF